MLTALNKTDPGTYTDELVSKAWSDVDRTPADWPSVKERNGIHDGHLMDLAHQMVAKKHQMQSLLVNVNSQNENKTSTSTTEGERAQPFVPDASVAFPKMSPIAGATDPNGKGRINSLIPPMGYVGATPPGQVLDGFTQMPGNGPHPYEGMNGWQYIGRLGGEFAPGWDKGRQALEDAKRIAEKRERGEPITENDMREIVSHGAGAAMEIGIAGVTGGIAKKGLGAVLNYLK